LSGGCPFAGGGGTIGFGFSRQSTTESVMREIPKGGMLYGDYLHVSMGPLGGDSSLISLSPIAFLFLPPFLPDRQTAFVSGTGHQNGGQGGARRAPVHHHPPGLRAVVQTDHLRNRLGPRYY